MCMQENEHRQLQYKNCTNKNKESADMENEKTKKKENHDEVEERDC